MKYVAAATPSGAGIRARRRAIDRKRAGSAVMAQPTREAGLTQWPLPAGWNAARAVLAFSIAALASFVVRA